mgnify:CR=1 FL=1
MTNEVRVALQTTCAAFAKFEVDYLIIGGIAVGLHGYNRVSHGFVPGSGDLENDIDLWYRPSIENYYKIIKALDELGVDTTELNEKVFDPKTAFMKIPFKGFHVELLPQMTGVDPFTSCKERALKFTLDGNALFVINRYDLLRNKEAIGREIDKRDIEELKKNPPSDTENKNG